jgi:hypothetical protein
MAIILTDVRATEHLCETINKIRAQLICNLTIKIFSALCSESLTVACAHTTTIPGICLVKGLEL